MRSSFVFYCMRSFGYIKLSFIFLFNSLNYHSSITMIFMEG